MSNSLTGNRVNIKCPAQKNATNSGFCIKKCPSQKGIQESAQNKRWLKHKTVQPFSTTVRYCFFFFRSEFRLNFSQTKESFAIQTLRIQESDKKRMLNLASGINMDPLSFSLLDPDLHSICRSGPAPLSWLLALTCIEKSFCIFNDYMVPVIF